MTIYRVRGWAEFFESAKSRTYKLKSQSYTPNKHGLGYRMMVRRPNGAAIFGAWRAMTDVLSRQTAPRQGYCTDTGRADGLPLTPAMLEALTDIPAATFADMLTVASSQVVGWLDVLPPQDAQYPHGIPVVSVKYQPLNPSPLPSPSPLESPKTDSCTEPEQPPARVPPHKRVAFDKSSGRIIGTDDADLALLSEAYPAIDVRQTVSAAGAWLLANPTKRKANVWRFLTNWCARQQERGGGKSGKPSVGGPLELRTPNDVRLAIEAKEARRNALPSDANRGDHPRHAEWVAVTTEIRELRKRMEG